jgi:hypothetical protein
MRSMTFAVALTLSLSGAASAQEFEEYLNTRDGFKIDFPGTPAVAEITYKTQQNYELPGSATGTCTSTHRTACANSQFRRPAAALPLPLRGKSQAPNPEVQIPT